MVKSIHGFTILVLYDEYGIYNESDDVVAICRRKYDVKN